MSRRLPFSMGKQTVDYIGQTHILDKARKAHGIDFH